ncbi:MAG: thiamine biosynthesis protein ThiS [Betaproteobacteria bacterium HGW-Betaproteobacteria-5]|jgi:sulfur carrier protein|nr:MAG: thiamine biosynthesis protein ThiS [Betaproteobacteria bacterium HGW-Betaproteobacteria-5]PKO40173.1 MAG: thiamine biosynthesis protein ThiS [Betaproteobacteria bacterium HGW-Betaproteobacteria-6]PKO93167.1 MAG: thiamine biosynthesis protein ThiS [Betaproteobacteria bacterium HGW-Betaproteobacteria-10]
MSLIIVNGQKWLAKQSVTLAELLEELRYTGKRIAIERNGEIVPKSQYEQTYLTAGDRVEIIAAVGGG